MTVHKTTTFMPSNPSGMNPYMPLGLLDMHGFTCTCTPHGALGLLHRPAKLQAHAKLHERIAQTARRGPSHGCRRGRDRR